MGKDDDEGYFEGDFVSPPIKEQIIDDYDDYEGDGDPMADQTM